MKKLLFIMVLVMSALVVHAQTTPIKIVDLQKSITDNIAKDYVGFTIKDATKVIEKDVVTYDVVVVKGTLQETLCYDNTGKFLKKMGAKAGVAKPAPKPASKPTTTKPPTK
jgi:hypothetical protein